MIELLKTISVSHWFLAFAAYFFHIAAAIEVARKKVKQRGANWIWARYISDNVYSWIYSAVAVVVVVVYAQSENMLSGTTALAWGYSAADVLARLTRRAQIQTK